MTLRCGIHCRIGYVDGQPRSQASPTILSSTKPAGSGRLVRSISDWSMYRFCWYVVSIWIWLKLVRLPETETCFETNRKHVLYLKLRLKYRINIAIFENTVSPTNISKNISIKAFTNFIFICTFITTMHSSVCWFGFQMRNRKCLAVT